MNKEEMTQMFKGPKFYAHFAGQEMKDYWNSMKGPKNKRFHKYANYYFINILNWYSPKDICKIVKVWMFTYSLRFDPDTLASMDRLHEVIRGLPESMPRREIEEYL